LNSPRQGPKSVLSPQPKTSKRCCQMSRQLLQQPAAVLPVAWLSSVADCQAAATAPAVHDPSYEWRLTVQCRRLCGPPDRGDIVLVRLLRRPLTGGAEVEVFVSASGFPRRRPPSGRGNRDEDATTFSVKTVVVFQHDDGGRRQLQSAWRSHPGAGRRAGWPSPAVDAAMTPAAAAGLFVNGKQNAAGWHSLQRQCRQTAGQPIAPGSRSSSHLKGAVRTWTGPVTPGSKTMTVYSSVTHSVKIELGSHGAVYGCQLKPHPMFAHLNITYGVKSDPIRVLYTVRRIELQPYRDNYFHGDRIDCLAKAGRRQKSNGQEFEAPGRCSPVPKSVTMRTRVRRLTESGVIITGCCSPSASTSTTGPLRPPPDHRSAAAASGRRSRRPHQSEEALVRSHHRGISVFLITFGVICGFALIAVVFAYLYSTAFSSSTAYGRLRDNPEDRLRFYGDNGRGNGGAYCDTSDEEEGSVSQPLNKAKDTSWIAHRCESPRRAHTTLANFC
uniref:CUB domain-containing protein n=1 Tax=Macrostomum lignano TaxID=282301 RepID=A0A1I8FKF0_9PLAT